jgi:multicomponent Na+:H+ antiporter subunit C
METALALLAGLIAAGAVRLMLEGNLVRFLFGLVLASNAVNLAIFAVGRLSYAAPPLIAEGAQTAAAGTANALPQALILTAIVISFGLLVFALALALRAHRVFGTLEVDALRAAEPETMGDAAREGER